MRRTICSLLAVVSLAVGLVAVATPAGAVGSPYRRWSGPKTFWCEPNGGTAVRVRLSDQNVEFNGLPGLAKYTTNYVLDGVTTTGGPYPVELTDGTKSYGSFAQGFASYPFTFTLRTDTLINGSVVYTSALTVTCTGNSTGTVTPVNTVVPTSPYRRWSGAKEYTCAPNPGSGGAVSVTLSDQNVEFNDLTLDDTYKGHYIKNGLITTSGPWTVEQTSGTLSYFGFITDFESYPFTLDYRFDTLVGGTLVYTSKLVVTCTGDGTGTVAPINAVVVPDPFASWDAFIKRQYQDLWAKDPSASSLNAWRENLSTGAKTKGELIDGLRRGSENTTNVDPVARLYRAFLARTPDAAGLRFWVNRRRTGTWTLSKMADSFASSNEFKTKYGALTNRQFVTRIYTDVLGRAADVAGVNYWTGRLDAHAKTRGQVMVGFSESSEYRRKQAENTDVAVAYIYLLGRKPSALEVADWTSREKAGLSNAELAKELVTSSAYAARFPA